MYIDFRKGISILLNDEPERIPPFWIYCSHSNKSYSVIRRSPLIRESEQSHRYRRYYTPDTRRSFSEQPSRLLCPGEALSWCWEKYRPPCADRLCSFFIDKQLSQPVVTDRHIDRFIHLAIYFSAFCTVKIIISRHSLFGIYFRWFLPEYRIIYAKCLKILRKNIWLYFKNKRLRRKSRK